jgi:hypothetical protein
MFSRFAPPVWSVLLAVVAITALIYAILFAPRTAAQATSGGEITMFQVMQRQTDLMERLAVAAERQATALEHIEIAVERIERE